MPFSCRAAIEKEKKGPTKKSNQIFNGRKISTDILRHVFLTDRYGKVQADMKETAKHMGHDTTEQALYIKR